jgi:hypothetical protein
MTFTVMLLGRHECECHAVRASTPGQERLWLVLPFRDQDGWLNNQQASRIRRQLDGSSDKGLDPAEYMPLTKDAARRAAKLEERHRRNDTRFPHDNPSSSRFRLLSAVGPNGG